MNHPIQFSPVATRAAEAGLENVIHTDAYLANAAAKTQQYLLALNAKKFLFWFYRTAGLQPPTETGYAGWEDGDEALNFRGHASGHYMSALAMSYASAKDQAAKNALLAQITDAVSGLAEVQRASAGTLRDGYISPFRDTALDQVEGIGASDDPVVVPYYNLHKVLAGLLDIHLHVPGSVGREALVVATGFGGYVSRRVEQLGGSRVLLGTEYGGMNDALYELFNRTGDVRFKSAAEGFDEVALFRDLAGGNDVLAGRHANTTIPKIIGALKRYTVFTENPDYYALLTQPEKDELSMYYNAAVNFWDIVVKHHSYATGGNSQSEHFHAPGRLWEFATQKGAAGNPQTAETCNAYNMLKLSRELFKITTAAGYADFYENTFINTILSSQNPDTGMSTYFQPMAPGYNKVYGKPFTDFWCCTGTGMENFSKLADSIYFVRGNSVLVNMFFSSSFDFAAANMRIRQEAALPSRESVRFSIESLDGGPVAQDAQLHLRVPGWAAGACGLRRNGKDVALNIAHGYATVPVRAGDHIKYVLAMDVALIQAPDNSDFFALKYGPTLLSAGLGKANMAAVQDVGIGVRIPVVDETAQHTVTVSGATHAWKSRLSGHVVRMAGADGGTVEFRLKGTIDGGSLTFSPHYRQHNERYMLYLNLEAPGAGAVQQGLPTANDKPQAQELHLDSVTIFDNNNFEADKGKKSSTDSRVGLFGGRQFRRADGPDGWFSYELAIDPTMPEILLRSDYFTGDQGCSFDVYVNDQLLKSETVTADAGERVFYAQYDRIPARFLQLDGNTRYKVNSRGDDSLTRDGAKIPIITVRFQSTGSSVGRVFGVFTTQPEGKLAN